MSCRPVQKCGIALDIVSVYLVESHACPIKDNELFYKQWRAVEN